MEQITVQFYSDGLALKGTLVKPKTSSATKVPGVVFCQGYGSSRDLNSQPELAERLGRLGFASLRFDHRGIGESEGERGRLFPWEQVQDIRNALTFLASEEGIDPDRIALVGSSFGAANAIVAGGLDKRVSAVSAAMPFANGRRWMQVIRRYWEWDAFLQRLADHRVRRVRTGTSEAVPVSDILVRDPEGERYAKALAGDEQARPSTILLECGERIIEYAPEDFVADIAPRPLLLIHGDRDTLIPPEESLRLHERAGANSERVVLKGVGHYGLYRGEPLERYAELLENFLRRSLL